MLKNLVVALCRINIFIMKVEKGDMLMNPYYYGTAQNVGVPQFGQNYGM